MNAYIRNRQNRPEFPEDREKFGTEFLDNIGDRINETAFGSITCNALISNTSTHCDDLTASAIYGGAVV